VVFVYCVVEVLAALFLYAKTVNPRGRVTGKDLQLPAVRTEQEILHPGASPMEFGRNLAAPSRIPRNASRGTQRWSQTRPPCVPTRHNPFERGTTSVTD